MTGFTAQWLALREPVDARARRREPGYTLRGELGDGPLEIVDLGAGTGANLRFLAPFLGGIQHWTLIDDDAALIAAQAETLTRWAPAVGARLTRSGSGLTLAADDFTCDVSSAALDLAADLERLPVPAHGVVTASALLDLVSDAWLARLVARIAAARAVCFFALTYDGRVELDPAHPDDALVQARFNAHQRRDKGFGPALGPAAPAALAGLLTAHGYALASAPSDWRAGPDDAAFAALLIDGWVAAALEGGAARAPTSWHGDATHIEIDERASDPLEAATEDVRTRILAWGEARRDALARGDLALTVGHLDLAAWLPSV